METQKNRKEMQNGSGDMKELLKNVPDIPKCEDYPVDNSNPCDFLDNLADRLDWIFTYSTLIPSVEDVQKFDTAYKFMELYYRNKLMIKTIKEQILKEEK